MVDEDTKYAVYNTFQAKVSKGGSSTKSYTTTNLVSHLTKHLDVIHKIVNVKLPKKLHLGKKQVKEKSSTNSPYRKCKNYRSLGT